MPVRKALGKVKYSKEFKRIENREPKNVNDRDL